MATRRKTMPRNAGQNRKPLEVTASQRTGNSVTQNPVGVHFRRGSCGKRVATPRRVVLGAVAVLCVAGPLGFTGKLLLRWIGADRTSHANVILISIDTLRADRLSLYGYDRLTSPHLTEFASHGIVFERFYQNGGGTLESHLTMMTSLRERREAVAARRGSAGRAKV